jgi:hypothetical protein
VDQAAQRRIRLRRSRDFAFGGSAFGLEPPYPFHSIAATGIAPVAA